MRLLLLTLGAAVAIYLALVICVYAFQSRLVYLPDGRALTASPTDIGLAFEEVRITVPHGEQAHGEPADGAQLHAWYVPGAPGAATVLFCHGNAGNISHRLEWLKIFNDLGLAVLLFDYRGYGQSAGVPTEEGTYEDARAAWRYLTNDRQLSPDRIVIFGESLGGAIAANLAGSVSPGALIVTSAFTSVPDIGSEYYWYLPLRLIARIRYPTADYISRVGAPKLIIHSRDDEIVPFAHGQELYRRASNPREFLEIAGDHNAGFVTSQATVTQGLRDFLHRHTLAGA